MPAEPYWLTRLVRADTTTGWDGLRWTSSPLSPGWPEGADQAVASWNVDESVSAAITIRARTRDGAWQPWRDLARWGAPGDRPSGGSAPAPATDSGPVVDTDVLTARRPEERFDAVQLRLELTGEADPSSLRLAAVSFSAPEAEGPPGEEPSAGAGARGAAGMIVPLSQRAHPARADLGGGGPAWCSPTSLTMVLAAWGAALPAVEGVAAGADPRIPAMAQAVFDAAYDGTGNWSFNAAVAGALGFDAVVTRLPSLREAAVLTEAGIPLIASISFGEGELPGADYATAGHLLVLRGIDAHGDVAVADPACPPRQDGRGEGLRTYPRSAFDAAWARSRRTVYLVVPRGHALPASPDGAW